MRSLKYYFCWTSLLFCGAISAGILIQSCTCLRQAITISSVPFRVTLYSKKYFKGENCTVSVDRCTNVLNFNDKSVSIAAPHCVIIYEGLCCRGKSHKIYSKLDNLESVSFDRKISSLSPCGDYTGPAPHQIHESWAGHGQIMTKVAEGLDTAIYYNDDLRRNGLRSHSEYVRKLWLYVKETYGNFGPENGRLYAFFHAGVPQSVYSYNSIQSYFDIQSECRNVIDLVGWNFTAWSRSLEGNDMDLVTHEVAHIVEWSSLGVHGSPTFNLWGDSAWADIFTYDVYNSLGLVKEKERFIKKAVAMHYDFPQISTFWFRDWFYPIYTNHGGTRLLQRYFQILAEHFPKKEDCSWQYSRNINLGEFVHFFSGAATLDLLDYASRAFKWDSKAEKELIQAKQIFSGINYSKI